MENVSKCFLDIGVTRLVATRPLDPFSWPSFIFAWVVGVGYWGKRDEFPISLLGSVQQRRSQLTVFIPRNKMH